MDGHRADRSPPIDVTVKGKDDHRPGPDEADDAEDERDQRADAAEDRILLEQQPERVAEQEDIDKWIKARSLEREVMYKSRTLAVNLGLEMKISDVEYQGDLSKATFYYTAEGRVDFRQLIKDMAEEFRIRIDLNHPNPQSIRINSGYTLLFHP